ncbi:hypothetical protein OG948_53625 (plasmid) [Embleya sp. NBC_00888]|uniref:hypothetical protein n=1 Tax=Embleya sp. NBC_00888 TaxID=2975960 RepID=UPI002F90D900|nr:hypothetical protein OG948_53625 [Embleya sp. NBC_00888]
MYEALSFPDRPVLEGFGAVHAERRRTPYAYRQALTVAPADGLPEYPSRRRAKSGEPWPPRAPGE